jgi:hypothetical protein
MKINIDELRMVPDGSICDCETIRQISLYSLDTKNDDTIIHELINKIDERFMYAGLYPHMIKTDK